MTDMEQELRRDWFGCTDVRDAHSAVICAVLCAALVTVAATQGAVDGVPWEMFAILAGFAAVIAGMFAFGLFAILPGMVCMAAAFVFGTLLL